jgi:ribosomal protein S18 acetylase RimI-like enzyme
MSDARERAISFRHAVHAGTADQVVRWEHGSAVYARDFARVWTLNSVRLEGPDPGIAAEDLVVAVDRLQAEFAHRHLEVEDEAAGRRLRPAFEALGWDADRLAWMELTGPARADPSGVEITEVPFPRTRPLRETWHAGSGWMPTAEAARDFIDLEDQLAPRIGSRALAAWGPAGELIGYAAFAVAQGIAEVEQAYVQPDRRGEGIGGALVAAAVAAAGTERAFIVADDEQAAKRLYARLGFEPVWIQHQFIRRPPET